uniref:Ubiquitin-protein ligase n=1 Tax=Rhizophora mucronata TaxID=61149 RepID=A0A2P2JNX2_RHIMU
MQTLSVVNANLLLLYLWLCKLMRIELFLTAITIFLFLAKPISRRCTRRFPID